MYVLDPGTLGLTVMALYATEGVFVLFSPGSIRFQRPSGGVVSWLYNILNLGTTLLLTPLVGLTLLRGWSTPGRWMGLDWGATHPARDALGWAGLALFAGGIALICWSRAVMGRSFRLGAVPPDQTDRLVVSGPFRLVRHPMYTGVLSFSFGLGLVAASWLLVATAVAIALTLVRLVPTEEEALHSAYGAEYAAYAARTARLLPGVY